MTELTPVLSAEEIALVLWVLIGLAMLTSLVAGLRAAYNAWLDRRWQAGEPARVKAMLRHPAGGRGNR